MFSATIIFGPGLTPCTLNFRKFDTALKVNDAFDQAVTLQSTLTVRDDYGQAVVIAQPLHACVVSDLNAQMEADIEKALIAARTQAKAQTAAGSDPVLKMAMMGGHYPHAGRLGQ